MRISDWSSDVCYSDLNRKNRPYIVRSPDYCAPFPEYRVKVTPRPAFQLFGRGGRILDRQVAAQDHALRDRLAFGVGERKSVVQGKSVSVRVDLGGSRIIIKKASSITHSNLNNSTISS